jgi:hypothetical protein
MRINLPGWEASEDYKNSEEINESCIIYFRMRYEGLTRGDEGEGPSFFAYCSGCYIVYKIELMSIASPRFKAEMLNLGKPGGCTILINLRIGSLMLGPQHRELN